MPHTANRLRLPAPRATTPLARALLLASLLSPVALAALPLSAHASETRAAAFDVPAGDLDLALSRFGQQAGIQLAVDASVTAGRRSPGVQGTLPLAAALQALLAGTGLEAVRDTLGEYTLRTAPAQTNGAAATLGAVNVTANQLGEITESSGSYTPGAIATATRLVLTPRETPQSISVITRQEMDDFSLTSIDKVMEHTPGVSILTFDSERTVYMSRGFAINTFQYDGIPMQRDSAYSSGNTLSDMAIYDRVETLKGATGLLSGAGEPGATLNLIRKKPTRDFQGSISLGAGSWENARTQLDFGGALNDSGSIRGRAIAAYQDKHAQLDHYRRKTSVFYGILEADLTPDTLLTIGADYQDNDPKGSTWGGIPLFDSNGDFNKTARSFNPGARWSNYEQYTRTVFSTLEHYFDNDWVAKLQLNHQINGYDAQLGSIGSGSPDPSTGAGTSLWVGQYIGKTVSNAADLYASGPFQFLGRKHELVLGGSIARRKWTNKGYYPGAYDTTVPHFYTWNGMVAQPDWANSSWQGTNDETTRENGFYATVRLNPRDDLKVLLGSRIASYKSPTIKESGVVVPYVGVVYDLNRHLSLYGSYTSIFQPQSVQNEQGRTLDPVDGTNHEIGLKGEFFNGRLNTSLAGFRIEQDNYALATGGQTPSGGVAYRAAQGVVVKGYELTVSGQLQPNWQLQAGYTHKIARLDGSKVSTENPEDLFSLFTSVKLPGSLNKLTLGGGARWQSKAWADVSNPVRGTEKHTLEARWLVDAMARWQFDERLSATLNINNLFDKQYYTMMSFYNTYSWGEGRNAMLTLDYKF